MVFFRFIAQDVSAIITRFGAANRVRGPGLVFYIPIIESVQNMYVVPLQQFFDIKAKTVDDVSVNIRVGLRYKVERERAAQAWFSLVNPINHFDSVITNVVRSFTQNTTLDELYRTDSLRNNATVSSFLDAHAYKFLGLEVVNIEPDSKVVQAMNAVNASQRLALATKIDADARYIAHVRDAESDARAAELKGQGMAAQRDAILSGWNATVTKICSDLDLHPKDVLSFALSSQRLDTMKDLSSSPATKTVFFDASGKTLVEDIVRAKEA